MKSHIVLLSLTFATSISLAAVCPNLAGKYNCTGNSKDFDGSIEVRQTKLANGATQYHLPYVEGADDNPVYTKIADGKIRSRKESTHMGELMTHYQNTCKLPSQLVEKDSMPAIAVQVTVVYAVSNDGKKMTVNETLSQGTNSRKTSAVCTKTN